MDAIQNVLMEFVSLPRTPRTCLAAFKFVPILFDDYPFNGRLKAIDECCHLLRRHTQIVSLLNQIRGEYERIQDEFVEEMRRNERRIERQRLTPINFYNPKKYES